jgi:bacterioferritin-associated ferredoxin
MYVCLCNGYRDAEIREVAETGVRCVQEVYLTLGNGPCCGSCLDFAQDIVDGVHTPANQPKTLPTGAEDGDPEPAAGSEDLSPVLMAAE